MRSSKLLSAALISGGLSLSLQNGESVQVFLQAGVDSLPDDTELIPSSPAHHGHSLVLQRLFVTRRQPRQPSVPAAAAASSSSLLHPQPRRSEPTSRRQVYGGNMYVLIGCRIPLLFPDAEVSVQAADTPGRPDKHAGCDDAWKD